LIWGQRERDFQVGNHTIAAPGYGRKHRGLTGKNHHMNKPDEGGARREEGGFRRKLGLKRG